jgi:hypothetical protein
MKVRNKFGIFGKMRLSFHGNPKMHQSILLLLKETYLYMLSPTIHPKNIYLMKKRKNNLKKWTTLKNLIIIFL